MKYDQTQIDWKTKCCSKDVRQFQAYYVVFDSNLFLLSSLHTFQNLIIKYVSEGLNPGYLLYQMFYLIVSIH